MTPVARRAPTGHHEFRGPAADGRKVSVNTVAASMVREGLRDRSPRRERRCLTRPEKAAAPIRDLLKRDFHAEAIACLRRNESTG